MMRKTGFMCSPTPSRHACADRSTRGFVGHRPFGSAFLFSILHSLFSLSLVFPVASFAQTKEQAISTLQRMSPDEIDRKIKEMGMTREEAVQKAASFGVSLEDFLSKGATTNAPAGSTPTMQQVAPPAQPETTPIMKVEVPVQKPDLSVPGITGRRGTEGLQPFGYDIFQYPASTFEPVVNVATPSSYLLGPGDEVIVAIWGETKLNYQVTVSRDGNVIIPDVGPVSAQGQTITAFKERLLRRMTGVYSSLKNGAPDASSYLEVSLGRVRTIQVFVLGEVSKPGGYSISSMSTVIHALYLSGGPSVNGTLREIQAIREGKTIATVDAYEFIASGLRKGDVRLQDGDVVFVKPAGKRVAIAGPVLRPAIYEMKGSDQLRDLLELAGGLRFDAYVDRVHVERVIPFAERTSPEKNVREYDVTFSSVKEMLNSRHDLQDGDIVTLFRILDRPTNRVTISGNVNKPGVFELRGGMTVADLIRAADSLQRNTFSERGTIFRVLPNLRREVIAFSPRLALSGDASSNIVLANEDEVVLYAEQQFFPERQVSVWGAVRAPGQYPRHENMTVADLVVMAGGLLETAKLDNWELAQLDTVKVGVLAHVKKLSVEPTYWKRTGDGATLLSDLDVLSVPFDPVRDPQRVVEVTGQVMLPGSYALKHQGERIADVITRAGGLKDGAYLEGSRVYRRRGDAGLIGVDLKRALTNPSSDENIALFDGDSINVAEQEDVVYIRGDVFVPSAAVYVKGASLSYYLAQAGGITDEADAGRIHVTLPNGRKWQKGWFIFPDPEILPGSNIFVPQAIEKVDKTLPVLRDWATIMASTAAIIVAIIQVTR